MRHSTIRSHVIGREREMEQLRSDAMSTHSCPACALNAMTSFAPAEPQAVSALGN